jgi:hypothetical protein
MALTADRWARGGRQVELVAQAFVEGIVTAREAGRWWRGARAGATPAPAR